MTPAPILDPTILAAGDIASYASTGDSATAAVLDVLRYGDHAGNNVYERHAGRIRQLFRPDAGGSPGADVPGAREPRLSHGRCRRLLRIFRRVGRRSGEGLLQLRPAVRHIIVIINIAATAARRVASRSVARADLAANPTACALAYWHHPLFSSGLHGGQAFMRPIFQALYGSGADVVLSGHDHDYERFAPQTPWGIGNAMFGIREFVVGTGGRVLYPLSASAPHSEVRNSDAFGVLMLTLHPSGYDWQFVPEAGKTFADSGSGTCHGAPPVVGGVAAQFGGRPSADARAAAGRNGDMRRRALRLCAPRHRSRVARGDARRATEDTDVVDRRQQVVSKLLRLRAWMWRRGNGR
jgi:hypothetical protein